MPRLEPAFGSRPLLVASPAALDPPLAPCKVDETIALFTGQKTGLRSAEHFAGSGQAGVGNEGHLTAAPVPFAL